jgi:hypothetical protein
MRGRPPEPGFEVRTLDDELTARLVGIEAVINE